MQQLAEQYAEAQKQYAEWVRATTLLAEDHEKMGAHITKLTDAYDALTDDLSELLSLIHAAAEQKRKAGDQWDRVESLNREP